MIEKKQGGDDQAARMAVVRFLRSIGYEVVSTASGSGAPAFSRISISKDGKVESCSIKTTVLGRISFTRESDGYYKVLSENDYVIHARHNGKVVVISMFPKNVVIDAFEKNHRAKVAHGMEHTPSWVNPVAEPNATWKIEGSGFQDKAIWTKTVPLGENENTPTEENEQLNPESSPILPDIFAEFKSRIASGLSMQTSAIKIDIRISY